MLALIPQKIIRKVPFTYLACSRHYFSDKLLSNSLNYLNKPLQKEYDTKNPLIVKDKKDHKLVFNFKKEMNFNVKEYNLDFYVDPNKDLTEDFIMTANFDELLQIATITLEKSDPTKEPNWSKWLKILQRMNDLLCLKQIGKNELLDILVLLNAFQPKIIEKQLPADSIRKPQSEDQLSHAHKQKFDSYYIKSDLFILYALHLKKHLSYAYSKFLEKEVSKGEPSTVTESTVDDVIGTYITFFENIEKKVTDDIIHGRVNYMFLDCVKLIQGFSRAKEGTNMFYEVMMRKISKNIKNFLETESESPESQDVIEILINYLPHDLYRITDGKLELELHDMGKFSEEGITQNIEDFYQELLKYIVFKLPKLSDDKLMSFFQGTVRMHYIERGIVSCFISEFSLRITRVDNPVSLSFLFEFLQIITYFMKSHEEYFDLINLKVFVEALDGPFLKRFENDFTFKQIATIFWAYYNLKLLNAGYVLIFEERLYTNLMDYIKDPKKNFDNLGYDSTLRYYDRYGLERYDVEAAQFFVDQSGYKGKLTKALSKARKLIELEDTHPITKKWFFF